MEELREAQPACDSPEQAACARPEEAISPEGAEEVAESRPGGSEDSGAPPPQEGEAAPAPAEEAIEAIEAELPAALSGDALYSASLEAAASLALEDQLRRIQALDPGVRSWEEVAAGPQGAQFARLVRQGCTPVEAYQVTRFEAILSRRVAAARRAALQAAYGKAHLRATSAAVGDQPAVPPEVEQQYRAFFPGWSEAQIRADYHKRQR